MINFWKPMLLKKINLISEKGTFLRWTLFTTFAIKVQMLCTIKCFSKCILYRIFYRLIMFIRTVTKNEQWRGTQGLFKLPDNSILFYRTKKNCFHNLDLTFTFENHSLDKIKKLSIQAFCKNIKLLKVTCYCFTI